MKTYSEAKKGDVILLNDEHRICYDCAAQFQNEIYDILDTSVFKDFVDYKCDMCGKQV